MTVMKLIGGLGLFGACCGLGFYYSHRLYRRVALLDCWETLCHYVLSQIQYGCTPLRDIWRSASEQSTFALLPFLKDADTVEWRRVMNDGVAGYTNVDLLPEDVRMIEEWIYGLGNSDMEGQTEHALRCAERLAKQREKAKDRADRVGRLYTMLGGLGGAAMVLLVW